MPETVITLTINEELVSARSGQTLLDVLRDHNIHIPTLCHMEGLSERGGCRLCMVELNNAPRPVAACVTPAAEGMVVRTHTPKMENYRRMTLELLFAERNHVCAVCVVNGHCELQSLAAQNNVSHVRFAYLHPTWDVDASHDRFVIDHNRCVLCTRCVRVCDEVEGAHTKDVAGRGIKAHIVHDFGMGWGNSFTCTDCGKCVQACPTGALFEKGASVAEMEKSPDFIARLVQGRQKKA